jgi:hypothetical protein
MLAAKAGITLLLGLAAGPAVAVDNYTFTAAIQGGFGGSLDVSGEQPFDESAFQLSFGMVTEERTLVVVRAGRLEFDDNHLFAGRLGAEIDYLNVAGEYRFRQPAYDFGFFLGVGAYKISGEPAVAIAREEQVIGFALGSTGDFDLTRHLSFVGEVDFHYVLFDDAKFYGVALAGLAIHF